MSSCSKEERPEYYIHSQKRMDSAIISKYGRVGLERKHKRDIQGPKERMSEERWYLGGWTHGFYYRTLLARERENRQMEPKGNAFQ